MWNGEEGEVTREDVEGERGGMENFPVKCADWYDPAFLLTGEREKGRAREAEAEEEEEKGRRAALLIPADRQVCQKAG